MNVWIMNLKDNREDKPEDLPKSKFDFCKDNNIVGIGWATEESKETDSTAFTTADHALDSFEIGDLVWVKNPFAENEMAKHYICQITEKAKTTDDATYNNNDIGKYCSCIYYPVSALPDVFAEERLVAVRAIEKANDSVAEKTKALFETFTVKKSISKKKLGVIALICVCVLLCGFVGVKVANLISRKMHPILPDGLEFGMTYDDIVENTTYFAHSIETRRNLTYQPLEANYYFLRRDEMFENYLNNNIEIGRLGAETFYFNANKELYQLSFFVFSDSDKALSDSDKEVIFDELCNYYKKAFGNIKIEEVAGLKVASFAKDSISCSFNGGFLQVQITNERYSPKIPEISKEAIGDALEKVNYRVSGFSENLMPLLNKCVSNMSIKYCTVYDAINEHHLLTSNADIVKVLEEDYPEYAATSYLIDVHGDISRHPEVPYLKTEDIDVIRLVLIFDDAENLMDYIVVNECSELNTYAILDMFG